MKNFKKITLGILGATILSLGLYACSNDNESTTNNSTTTEKTKMARIDYDFINMTLPDFLKSYNEEVFEVETEIELLDIEGNKFSGIMKLGIDEVGKLNRVEFSSNLLVNGLITEDLFINNPEIVNTTFGDSSPHADCVKQCTDNYVKDGKSSTGYGHCIAGCYIESTGRLIESIGNAIGNALDKVVISIKKIIFK